jgi:uncharacterized membrane protein
MNAGRLVVGFAILILGLVLISLSSLPAASYGALVLIGPFPILVSSDYGTAAFLVLLAFALIVLVQLSRWLR